MPYPNGYLYRAQIVLSTTQCGGGSGCGNFPLYFPGHALLATAANNGLSLSNGFDVVFATDLNGLSSLFYELVSGTYNAVTGAGEWFVNLGTGSAALSNTVAGVLYVFVGKAGVSDGSTRDNVNMWINYARVYHFGGGSSLSLADSAGGHTMTDAGGVGHAAGVPGVGSYGAVTTTKGPTDGNPAGNIYLIDTGVSIAMPFTLSSWAKLSASGDNRTIWGMNVNSGANFREGWLDAGNTFYATYNNNSPIDSFTFTGTEGGSWNYYAASADSTTARRYQLNANSPGSSAVSIPAPRTIYNFTIGNWLFNQDSGFWGSTSVFDEVRLSSISRTNDFNVAEYNTFSAPGTFYTLGGFGGAGKLLPVLGVGA